MNAAASKTGSKRISRREQLVWEGERRVWMMALGEIEVEREAASERGQPNE